MSEAILIGDIHAREDHGLSVIRVEIGVQEGAILVKESTERSIEGVMLIFGRDQDIHETLRQGECALADLFDLCVHRDLFDVIVAVECAGQDPLHTTEGDGIPLDHGVPILLILDRRIALAVLLGVFTVLAGLIAAFLGILHAVLLVFLAFAVIGGFLLDFDQ